MFIRTNIYLRFLLKFFYGNENLYSLIINTGIKWKWYDYCPLKNKASKSSKRNFTQVGRP